MVEDSSASPGSLSGERSGQISLSSAGRRFDYISSSSAPHSSAVPLTIRGANMETAPPPLPPPTHPPIASSVKPLWNPYGSTPTTQGTIRPGSSLTGSWSRNSAAQSLVPRKEGLTLLRDAFGDNDYRRAAKGEDELDSFPSLTAKIQEPRPLDTHNHRNATDAYDKHQLSKFGRPKTPTRSSAIGSIENSPIAGSRLRLETQPPLHRLTLTDRSVGSQPCESPFKATSPLGRWAQQPRSGTMSPSIISSTTSSHGTGTANLRSPIYEPSTAPSSFATDHNIFSRVGSMDRGSNASLSLLSSAFEDSEREIKGRANHVTKDRAVDPGKSSRASFEQGAFVGELEADSDLAAPKAGMRSKHADSHEYAQQPRHFSLEGPMSDAVGAAHQGLKRKASPNDASHEEPVSQAARSRTPVRSVKRTSPLHQPNPPQASFSSLSTSSLHNSSFPPTKLSVGPSSVTSVNSQDMPHPKAAASSITANSTDIPQSQSVYGQSTQSPMGHVQLSSVSVHAQQDGPPGKTLRDLGTSEPPLANIHMCDCCPKKPKKFHSLEALHAHQNEKQYYCNFCHNRFKNKNEAERHQNSLHLRKQSWSCAALENRYEKAFHASNAIPSSGNSGPVASGQNLDAEFDVCGYCGQQFPNYPNPDWLERSKHLTEIHKFGECNQSKKFFRADHFRQHLKHSHGGKPGKWTNMLESACLREELPPQPVDSQAQEQLRHQHRQQHNQIQASQALQAVQQQAASPESIASFQVDAGQLSVRSASPASAGIGNGPPRQGFSA